MSLIRRGSGSGLTRKTWIEAAGADVCLYICTNKAQFPSCVCLLLVRTPKYLSRYFREELERDTWNIHSVGTSSKTTQQYRVHFLSVTGKTRPGPNCPEQSRHGQMSKFTSLSCQSVVHLSWMGLFKDGSEQQPAKIPPKPGSPQLSVQEERQQVRRKFFYIRWPRRQMVSSYYTFLFRLSRGGETFYKNEFEKKNSKVTTCNAHYCPLCVAVAHCRWQRKCENTWKLQFLTTGECDQFGPSSVMEGGSVRFLLNEVCYLMQMTHRCTLTNTRTT